MVWTFSKEKTINKKKRSSQHWKIFLKIGHKITTLSECNNLNAVEP